MLASLICASINILSKSSFFPALHGSLQYQHPSLHQKAPVVSPCILLRSLLAYWCWRLGDVVAAASLLGVRKIQLLPNKPSSSQDLSVSWQSQPILHSVAVAAARFECSKAMSRALGQCCTTSHICCCLNLSAMEGWSKLCIGLVWIPNTDVLAWWGLKGLCSSRSFLDDRSLKREVIQVCIFQHCK